MYIKLVFLPILHPTIQVPSIHLIIHSYFQHLLLLLRVFRQVEEDFLILLLEVGEALLFLFFWGYCSMPWCHWPEWKLCCLQMVCAWFQFQTKYLQFQFVQDYRHKLRILLQLFFWTVLVFLSSVSFLYLIFMRGTLWLFINRNANCAHMRRIFSGLLHKFRDESLSEGSVEVVYEVFFGHLYNLNLKEYI